MLIEVALALLSSLELHPLFKTKDMHQKALSLIQPSNLQSNLEQAKLQEVCGQLRVSAIA